MEGAETSWNSRKQLTAAISSSDAKGSLTEVSIGRGFKSEGTTVIQEDNQSCIKMSKISVMQKRTKLMDLKHFVRERVLDGRTTILCNGVQTLSLTLWLGQNLRKTRINSFAEEVWNFMRRSVKMGLQEMSGGLLSCV